MTAKKHGFTTNQVARVLRICGAIPARMRRGHRHRGTTQRLCPGALLMTDGKMLDVELTGSGTRTRQNWQGMVDQATGCDVAVVVTVEEDAAAVSRAFAHAVDFLGGVAPLGLLHDNKPCYQDAKLRDQLERANTMLVPATIGRAENKAGLEGEFSLFQARVGTIRLDDTCPASLVQSAVREMVRAYTAATNGVPREVLGGLSRHAALRSARPSKAQLDSDRAFIRSMKERHERYRRSNWPTKMRPASRRLLGRVFARLGLEQLDPRGSLRGYLSIYEPAAIRQAAAIVRVRLARGELERPHAHRYLTKVIQSIQEELDLVQQEAELLELCRFQAQDWLSIEEAEFTMLQRDGDPRALALALAERAACGGLPVQGAFWIEKLVELLQQSRHLAEPVRRFLVRFYEAPVDRRRLLLDRVAAIEWGLA